MSERNRRGGRRDEGRAYGHGYGYGFGDSGDYRRQQSPRRGEEYRRWDRDRVRGGFGSEYGAWRSGASFGFGRQEDPRHESDWQGSPYGQGDLNTGRGRRGEFEDSDWVPNRPARGRGTWTGDWGMEQTGAGEYGSQYGGSYDWERGSERSTSLARENYRGRGPKDYRRSDERIREEICDRLTDDPMVDASEVTINVEGGEVILAGFVASRDQKRRAEEDAESISGVRDVINQLRVSRGDDTMLGTQSPQIQHQGSRPQRSSSTPQQSGVAADRERER